MRQLEQAVLAALAICETDVIQPSDFPVWFQSAFNADTAPEDPKSINLNENMPGGGSFDSSDPEYTRYLKALDSTKYSGTGRWNFSAAARRLGGPRKTFVYRLKKMQLIK